MRPNLPEPEAHVNAALDPPSEGPKGPQNGQRGLQRHRRWHVDFADVRIPERTLSERPWRL
ncbi:hypothetical protein SSAG_03285 [Streptomyces sp. Mg1]|nr:hypothetical protein SSAG_03285 [Streptomyces sp. Mg1]